MIRWIGIILIVIGLIAVTYYGIQFFMKEEVQDEFTTNIKEDRKDKFPFPPMISVFVLLSGVVVYIIGHNKSRRGPRADAVSSDA